MWRCPVAPALLERLAVVCLDPGWALRECVRLGGRSGAYRHGCRGAAEAKEKDPYNRLLAHQPPIRLDAEIVRDNALVISGDGLRLLEQSEALRHNRAAS